MIKLLKNKKFNKELYLKELPNIKKQIESNKVINPEFTFIDLFAGIGGFRIAAQLNKGACVFTSEIDQLALATYSCNFGIQYPIDITKYNLNTIPDHDLLCGGFPCQSFSRAGLRKGLADEKRGNLFYYIADILKAKKPKAFILENVSGLVTHEGGKTFKTIINILQKLNYNVHAKLMNSYQYGNVPQLRFRVYIVGFEKNKVKKYNEFLFPDKIPLTKRLNNIIERNVLKDNPAVKLLKSNKHYYNLYQKKIKVKNRQYLYNHIENKFRVNPKNLSYCLINGTSGRGVLLDSNNNLRFHTVSELKKIQGFPDNYYIPGFISYSEYYKQFGNSVTVPVVERIIKNIKKVLST